MKSILLPITILCLFSTVAFAQLPPACAGGSPATTCATACINCNFNGFVGNTTGFPSDVVPNFCGTVENAQWLGFIAGDDHAEFIVTPFNCSNGDGVQIALYEDCMGLPIACDKGEPDGGILPVALNVPLTPGHNYFLLIDGFAGDQCDFSVSVGPQSAVFEPPLGQVGSITGADKVCPGATMKYSVTEVFGASAYIWSGPPGAMIDTLPLPATVSGPGSNSVFITFGDVGGQICVQAANSCNQTPACTIPFSVAILDDSFRPVLEADTTAHLTCSGDPAALKVEVQAASGFEFLWSADSLGHIVSGANTNNLAVDKTGTYTLIVTNNQNGCTSDIQIHVGEPDTPKVADFTLKHITCYGFNDGFLQIGAMNAGLPPFLYAMDNDDFLVSPEFRYLTPGEHRLTIESADECRWDTVFIVNEPADWILDLGQDTTIHLGTEIQLVQELNLSEPDRLKNLEVTPDELTVMMCESCPYMPLNSFKYHVTVVDSNGCVAKDERIVSVTKERYVYAPNVFAPNAVNSANQVFTILGGEDVEQVNWLRIFDRWGQLIFMKEGFNPGDPTSGWNGQINGETASPGVFIWQADIQFIDGNSEKWSGSVTLVR
ncbi:MAG: gliding motility-associated C-terminal domain-containing protein [Saprospiraceae bacterium]|nr:gliding motility-associated C-terminal domain-containing protein [Saprospiraceae bacterium]